MCSSKVRRLAIGVVLVVALMSACGGEGPSSPAAVARSPGGESDRSVVVGAVVLSWKLMRDPRSQYLEPIASPAESAPDRGDPCSGLAIAMQLHDLGSVVEAEIYFHNPNEGMWTGELNVDFASEDQPAVRHVVVDNIDVEIEPEAGVTLFVTLALPGSPHTYDFRAFGVGGEAHRGFPVRVDEIG